MIPVRDFLLAYECKYHGTAFFKISFKSYDSKKHIVIFSANCMECEKVKYIFGYTVTMSSSDWNKLTPLSEEPKLN